MTEQATRMTRQRHTIALLSIVAMLAAAPGCRDRRGRDLHGRPVVRVGFFPNLGHAAALVGLESGRFATALGGAAALDARAFVAGTELVTALAAEEIDVAYLGPGPAIKAFSAGVPLRIVAGAAEGGSVVVARPDAGVRAVTDLAGKRVTVPRFGNTQDVLMRALLRQAGLQDTAHQGTVEVLQAESSDVLRLLQLKQIDAAIVAEPWGARLEKEAGASIMVDWRGVWRGGRYPSAVLVMREPWRRAHPALAERWLQAHRETVAWIRAEPEAALDRCGEAVRRHTGKSLPRETLARAFTRLEITDRVDAEALDAFQGLMREAGYLREPISVDGLVAPSTRTRSWQAYRVRPPSRPESPPARRLRHLALDAP
jgi:NitT/TauT family transport system substrate-binding protein